MKQKTAGKIPEFKSLKIEEDKPLKEIAINTKEEVKEYVSIVSSKDDVYISEEEKKKLASRFRAFLGRIGRNKDFVRLIKLLNKFFNSAELY